MYRLTIHYTNDTHVDVALRWTKTFDDAMSYMTKAVEGADVEVSRVELWEDTELIANKVLRPVQQTKRFEIRILDGFGTFTSIFKDTTEATAMNDVHKLAIIIDNCGATHGNIKLLTEDHQVLYVSSFG